MNTSERCPTCQRPLLTLGLAQRTYLCLACAKSWLGEELAAVKAFQVNQLMPVQRPYVKLEGLLKLGQTGASGLVLPESLKDPVGFETSFKAEIESIKGLGHSHSRAELYAELCRQITVTHASSILSGLTDDVPERDAEPPEEDRPDTPPPVLQGSVIGYRAWALNSQWQLVGTGYGRSVLAWLPGVNEAACAIHPHHNAPEEGCHCGFNCLARFSNDYAWWRVAKGPGSGDIVGAVEAWSDDPAGGQSGHLVIDPPGFRAKYAKIVLLAVDDAWPRAKHLAVRGLAQDYGVDICKLEHLEDAAKEHGQLIPDEMLAWAKPPSIPFQPTGSITMSSFSQMMSEAIKSWTMTTEEAAKSLSMLGRALGPQPHYKGPKYKKPKGIKQHRKTPGPPGLGKWKTGDRIIDSKQVIWTCVTGGKPGVWAVYQY